MLCGTSSLFVQVTAAPTGTRVSRGVKLKLSMAIVLVPAAVVRVSSSSVASVIAIGWLTSWKDSRVIPRTLRRRSASTLIGPGDGADPGAGCGKAVDIAVWNV